MQQHQTMQNIFHSSSLYINGQVHLSISLPDGLCQSVSQNIEQVFGIAITPEFYTTPFILRKHVLPVWDERFHIVENDIKNNAIPEFYTFQMKIRGEARWIQQHNKIVENNGSYSWESILFDITDTYTQQKKLEENERNFKNIFNASADAIVIHSITGEIIEYNQEFSRITNGSIIKSQNIFDAFELTTESKTNLIKQLNSNLEISDTVADFESILLLSTEEQVPIEVKSRLIEYANQAAAVTVIRDITARKDLEKKLLNTIVETEEKERQRLAIDLHDEIGPLLSSMKMYIQSLKDAKDANKIEYISNQLLELVKEAITATREISNSLSPHVLSNYGLIAAMTNMMDNIRPFIPVQFKTNCDTIRFDENVETVYYRIFKELSNNTLKHAKAKKIEISLKYANSTLYLQYSDDGVGFSLDEKLTSKKDGIGLFNILSRVQAINGEYVIKTSKGHGFRFELRTKTKTK